MPSTLTLTPTDPRYPAALLALSPPPDLHVRGALPSGPAVAIVGTRHPSGDGERFARALAATLTRSGVVVWSGGAIGIDDQAHHGALDAGGPTVLVAGGGLDRVYPATARSLWARVARQGALVSLCPDAYPPAAWTLLRRNGALAALADAVVLVEAPLQSGARSTTAAARRLGRPVWVVGQAAWSPFAPTVREEMRLGARLLLHADDLLASLALPPVVATLAPAPQLPLDLAPPATGAAGASSATLPGPSSRLPARAPVTPASALAGARTLRERILEAIEAGVGQLDGLCETLQTPTPDVLAEVTTLLIEGAIHEHQPGIFQTHPTRGKN